MKSASWSISLTLLAACPDSPDPHPQLTFDPPPSSSDAEDSGEASDPETTATPTTAGPDETSDPLTSTTPGETTDVPCEPDVCDDLECSTRDDGCGGELDCGGCPDGLTCQGTSCELNAFDKATELWSTSNTTYPLRSIAWSVDGNFLASGGCDDFPTEGEFIVWHADGSGPVWGYEYPPRGVLSVAWHPDGSEVVLGTQGSWPRIHSATTGDLVDELGGCHDGEIRGVSWRADGKRIASAGAAAASPGAKPEWCIWDADTHAEVFSQTDDSTYAINDVAYTATDDLLAVVTDEFVGTYDGSYNGGPYVDFTGQLPEFTSLVGADWAPDNNRLLLWTYTQFFLVDFENDFVGGSIEYEDGVAEGAWSPGGHRFAIALVDGRVQIYDYDTAELELQFTAHDSMTTIDWSFHESYLATGGYEPRLAVWKLE